MMKGSMYLYVGVMHRCEAASNSSQKSSAISMNATKASKQSAFIHFEGIFYWQNVVFLVENAVFRNIIPNAFLLKSVKRIRSATQMMSVLIPHSS